ncbi:MAG: ribulose-phosphate 3-epimerase [Nitrospiraceae bacterium]|nr:ribulose-phosphate 3-epimerase [Nitrospiraceae bacterium]
MKFTVAPSILSADFSNLSTEIKKIEMVPNSWVHLDVMDGHFVPNLTFGSCVINSIRKVTNLFFDAHLMVDNPESFIDNFKKCGVNAITFHIEETHFPLRIIKKIRESGLKVGISVNPATSVREVSHLLPLVDLFLIMSVEPGFSGQKFIPFSIKKIQEAAKIREKNHLKFIISVDGGINEETAENTLKAGADTLVMGSFFFKNDFIKVTNFIENLRKK